MIRTSLNRLFCAAVLLGVLAGTAEASRDTTGYNWIGASATDVGHQPRYDHSKATTVGGGVTLALEYPASSPVGVRVSAAQWMFSGAPLTGDRQRTLLGAGLAVRFGSARTARLAPARTVVPGRAP